VEAFIIKRGDTLPSLEASLEDVSGKVNLSNAAVSFRLSAVAHREDSEGCVQAVPGAAVFTKPAVIVDAANGSVRYDWSSGDTASVGRLYGEFVATFSGGRT
jgi:hypothetical protein